MKVLTYLAVLILFFSSKAYPFSNEKVSARNLFMTTAGSVVETDKKQSSSPTTKKDSKKDTKSIVKIPSGLSIEVVKFENGKGISVNPQQYRFKTGDEFIVKFQTNVPGVVKVYNINPKNRINHLGTWIIKKGFMMTQLPPNEGTFKFINTKGKEKLIFEFYPCKVEEQILKQYTSVRDIVLVDNTDQQSIKYNDEFSNYLPVCYRLKSQIETKRVSSRDIILTSTADLIKFEDGANFAISEVHNKNTKPIVALIELRHK
ncbi:DUF4384 domain-containing protein [Thermodesulfobacterium sp. TA1]|uniref:DUF4384 domain-containing protein n=1 Tax=Thermodesulfobacterium sp. TA1 TaxID=2234087 RepID=UPI0012329977|nr:DUF4384 domain-containing protein [Thermodesulfobacterium sp. TA1]QER41751.1 DUF4384 domain-containing protein [Thermodesulfobacterium sp. TA1]